MSITIMGPEGMAFFRLCQIKAAVSLEAKGLRHSSGKSALALAKRVYGLKGNRASVLKQLEARIEASLLGDRQC